MLSNFCPKCMKLVCACVVTASIAGAFFGSKTDYVQADLPSPQFLGALMSGTTGPASQIQVVSNAISDEEYVAVWPDQRQVAVLGPTGPRRDNPQVEVRQTGTTGPSRSGGRELPKGPTGAAG